MKTAAVLIFAMILTTRAISAQTAPPVETGVSQTLAKWRAANYSDVRYKLNITLEKGAPLMKGDIEIRVNLTETGAKNDLILDWRTTQFANDKEKPFAHGVSVNDKPIDELGGRKEASDFFAYDDHLIVPKWFLKTGENVVKINFASPIKTSGAGVTRYVDREDGAEYVYSLFVPSDASTAFPVFDQPDLKARFQLGISVPKDWKVVTNSDSVSSSRTYTLNHTAWRDGFPVIISNNIFFFEETKPISTYVFAFAAGDFTEFSEGFESPPNVEIESKKTPQYVINNEFKERVSSKVFVRKSQAEKFKQYAAEVFRLNREGIKYLESYFDYKFPFPKYDLVLIPEFPFGGMEHAGATFLREDRIIFPTEPTKNDYITRANVIFHEAAHQWFGDTVTMRWFDDLWLKEGFAEFMAYKTLETVMPEYNSWKIFYERNKQAAYLTDSTKGTTPIYQEIPNLSAAKSAYGNIVYRKAPSFLRQAEFYLGEDKFQTAVRAFLKKHEFANAEWTDLVKEFETASGQDLKDWANVWVKQRGLPVVKIINKDISVSTVAGKPDDTARDIYLQQQDEFNENRLWKMKTKVLLKFEDKSKSSGLSTVELSNTQHLVASFITANYANPKNSQSPPVLIFPNYQDYGYGIFLLDEKSRAYVLANIQTETDDFLRTMMWGALWDSVRETELNPKDYVELVVKNINVESDESTIQTLLGRVSTAMNYYLPDKQREELAPQIETVLIDKMQNSPTVGQRVTFYRAFLNIASTEKARMVLKEIFSEDFGIGGGDTKMRPGLVVSKTGVETYAARPAIPLKTKDRFDIAARLLILNDASAPNMLAELEKSDASDEAKRYAYAARAAAPTAENKRKYFNDFLNDKQISESYIESAFAPFNAPRHADLTLPYLKRALAELPNLKRNRKIFFVNGWLAAFIGGQKSERALAIINKFLADNPNLDKDLRLKILENADGLERAVKIRNKFKGE